MQATVHHGYLLLADISGFTAFMAQSELEHAHAIVRELQELLIKRLIPPLRLASVDGDAVFAHAPAAEVPRGETVLELAESAYTAFKDRVTAIERRTTCQCTACRLLPMLDLKITVHHGEYLVTQTPSGFDLHGADAMLVRRRVLKEQIDRATHLRGYGLFTQASLECMAVKPADMRAEIVHSDQHGDVQAWVLDLPARYGQLAAERRVFIRDDQADLIVTYEFAAPPAVVWQWLNGPHERMQWMEGYRWQSGARPLGRTSVGATNHCQHRTGQAIETILDWRPFDYYTVEFRQPSFPMRLISTVKLEAVSGDSATRLSHVLQFQPTLPKWLGAPLAKIAVEGVMALNRKYAKLARLLSAGSQE